MNYYTYFIKLILQSHIIIHIEYFRTMKASFNERKLRLNDKSIEISFYRFTEVLCHMIASHSFICFMKFNVSIFYFTEVKFFVKKHFKFIYKS